MKANSQLWSKIYVLNQKDPWELEIMEMYFLRPALRFIKLANIGLD
jgi:hypothetical protein